MTQTYIGTPADIRRLTSSIINAGTQIVEGQQTYLKMVVGTTIHELGAKPAKSRTRGRQPKLSEEQIKAQLSALESVNERFYQAVLDAASEGLPRGAKERATLLNRRTNFARSAVSTVRSYIRAGNDITLVDPATCTKRSLQVERAARPPSVARMRRAVENRSKALMASVLNLVDTDKAAAREEIELLMGQLANELASLGGVTMREAPRGRGREAPPEAEGRGIFVPLTETQVVRQQARPS